jgi:hypothetical protein
MNKRAPKRTAKVKPPKPPPSRFAPQAFLAGSPSALQQLCDELAELAASRFRDLTGTTWETVGTAIAAQLRAIGHDLQAVEEAEGFQEWQATWYHPRGTFSLLLQFRAPSSVDVTWQTESATFAASLPE